MNDGVKRNKIVETIVEELDRTLAGIPSQAMERLVSEIVGAHRIFVSGAGRSGLMMKAFAMRLMHMGITAYVLGETVTPGIEAPDLLVIGSGSGETDSLVAAAQKAKRIGSGVALLTINPDSTLAGLADTVTTIPAPSPKLDTPDQPRSVQPMGSLFEQSLLLTLDAVVISLMDVRGTDTTKMFRRHANLE